MNHLTTKNQIAPDSYSVAIKKRNSKPTICTCTQYTFVYIMQHKNNEDREYPCLFAYMHCTIFHANYGKITEFNSLILLLF